MELRKLNIERYKGYERPAELEFAPLTILVGSNNSGKTALAQAIQLLAGGLVPNGKDPSEPLPLESGGIQHGQTFEDLVTRRSAHGRLRVAATLADDAGELSLSATVRNVASPPRSDRRQISDWQFTNEGKTIMLERTGFDDQADYRVSVSGHAAHQRQLGWQGLVPLQLPDLADWAAEPIDGLRTWALGIRHLQCPRTFIRSPFVTPDNSSMLHGADGLNTPLVLAADDRVRESVRKWCRSAFGVTIDVVAQGTYSELVTSAPIQDANVRLAHSGRGLSQVLPVVVTALTTRTVGRGVDVIEHPEAELHPAAQAHVAELLLDNLAGPGRPLIVETHSEILLLRARRWIAEGRLPADSVVIYWVDAKAGSGSVLRKISIDDKGNLDGWPNGVFIEDYEEILAIRRAARTDG